MRLEDLDKDDLLLVASSMATGKTLDDALSSIVPTQRKDIIDGFHSLFCRKQHIGESCCLYYTEKFYTDPIHLLWNNIVSAFIAETNSNDKLLMIILQYLWRVEVIRHDIEEKEEDSGIKLFDLLLSKMSQPEF